METQEALVAFDALSNEIRLKAYRLLVEYGPEGAPAGSLSQALGISHNALSFHLSQMSHAKLVISRRDGRSIIYAANFTFVQGLIQYMLENCCAKTPHSLVTAEETNCQLPDTVNCCA
jgi:ArsR family transcriptional regulator, arsenate/arsenite/antimonite-responsive transcriptional repressor